MNKAIKDSCEKPQDAGKSRIEVRPAVSFVSDATYHDSVKDKAKFIEVMCRYVLLWYNKVRDVIKQKLCEDAQAKFTMTKLLLEGQGLRTFLQLKTAVIKKVLVGDAQVPMGVTEESYAMTISKFKATAFKKYVQKKGNDKSENKTKSKPKGHRTSRKGKKSHYCKTVGGTYWNHNTAECGRIKYLKKPSGSHKSYRSSKNYDSKEGMP